MMAIELHWVPPPSSLPRSCRRGDGTPKRAYRRRRDARRAAIAMRHEDPLIHAYRCAWGLHHHVGHRPSWKAAQA